MPRAAVPPHHGDLTTSGRGLSVLFPAGPQGGDTGAGSKCPNSLGAEEIGSKGKPRCPAREGAAGPQQCWKEGWGVRGGVGGMLRAGEGDAQGWVRGMLRAG